MSSEPDTSGDPLARYHDKSCLVSPLNELRDDNARWLATRDESIDSLIRVQRIRIENPRIALAVSEAVRDDRIRSVLIGVIADSGVSTYSDVDAFTRFSVRTLKRRVSELRDDGVLDVDTSAKPAVVSFSSEAVEVLVKDALSLYDSTTTTMK